MNQYINILVAGIGGASLGTEVIKCLQAAGHYKVFGCDISQYAFGHFQEGIEKTFVIPRDRYVDSILELCLSRKIRAIVPGGEQPLLLLSRAAKQFEKLGILLAVNHPDLISICSNKGRLFERLSALGLPIPRTVAIKDRSDFKDCAGVTFPCVVKPAAGTGGSRFVFLTSNQAEAMLYVNYLLDNGLVALMQEYIPVDEGEFTVGVLSLPNARLIGSVAMRRVFHSKLSVLLETESGLISSGYSQGLIEDFPAVRKQAEKIASLLGSMGPMNIQGRLRDGILIPFEINPRFSASTYLRTMAGFNEIDIFLRYLLLGEEPSAPPMISEGYYLRSLTEVRINQEAIKQ